MEVFSVLFTPFVLMISLPGCANRLVQFFREFTVYVEGLGPVCKFAIFDVTQNGNREYGALSSNPHNEAQRTNHGKLEISILNFKVRFISSFQSSKKKQTPSYLIYMYYLYYYAH
jgi:autophagy-related protein 9